MEVELDGANFIDNCRNTEYLKEIPAVNSSVSYSQFFEKFILKNQACVIKNVCTNWESLHLWQKNGLPNFCYLISKYGNTNVSVQECSEMDIYRTRKCSTWSFQKYMDYWKDYIQNGYSKEMPLYYLKDWHLKKQVPGDNFYEVPLHFTSDWLNEYLVENSFDDYRFIYMGVKGTWSPFHVDVMTTYSWSTNICGQKRWVLFPPGEEKYLCDHLGNFPNDITHLQQNRQCFEVIQDPGDAIFVPSNWFHQVWNLKDTISINHNWINGCNLKTIWCTMEKNLVEIKEEINDCEDMDNFLDHCQVMLRATFGMDFIQFYYFISYVASKRLNFLQNGAVIVLPGDRKLGRNHALFDLQSIRCTLLLFIQHEDLENLTSFKNVQITPSTLINKIEAVL